MQNAIKFEIFVGLTTNQGKELNSSDIQQIKDYVSTKLQAYTVVIGLGVWEGIEENTLIISHIGQVNITESILEIAKIIRIRFKQDAVLVTATEIKTVLLEAFNKSTKNFGSIANGIGAN